MLGLASCSIHLESGSDAEGGAPWDPAPPVMLRFEEEGTLQLVPGELRTVRITVQPPAAYHVSFSLLGEAAGAWVDKTTITTTEDGRGSVGLHASNLGSTFRLRAATDDGLATELGVAVSAEGFGTLHIHPSYQGTRVAKNWMASVVAGSTCDEIAITAPRAPPGALMAHGGPEGPVIMAGAPVGPSLAVALYSGKMLWGCASERELQAGATRDVTVPIQDLPIDMAATRLDTTLLVSPSEGLEDLLAAAADRRLDEFLPEGGEAAALLDAMELAAPVDQVPAFAARRAALDWDATAQAHLAALSIPLRERCRGWARAGREALPLEIVGVLRGQEDTPGHARFEVSWLGSPTAESDGPTPAYSMSWTAESGDTLRLSGTLSWMPSRYLLGATEAVVAEEMPSAGSMPEALSAAAQCAELGASLGGYSGCDPDCMTALCAGGLKLRWHATMTQDGPPGEIVVNALGPAEINSAAVPEVWTARWLGTLSDGEGAAASVAGDAHASSTEP
ncbi:hypothetical protein SOCE26_034180 [Sorangium cellulosum]|uniref:Uncharacterized protein n=2 Tax=Sorangium cellulosum TaxID=56 RepID=A0A2L0ERR8_SORCE|nr:hypothetical protein SOCE26_034180 [Sorangium cellulosum]